MIDLTKLRNEANIEIEDKNELMYVAAKDVLELLNRLERIEAALRNIAKRECPGISAYIAKKTLEEKV